jgi:hypothetical protein
MPLSRFWQTVVLRSRVLCLEPPRDNKSMLETASLSATWCKSKSLPQQCTSFHSWCYLLLSLPLVCNLMRLPVSASIMCVSQRCAFSSIQDLVSISFAKLPPRTNNKQTKILYGSYWLTRSKWLSQIWIESTKTTFKSSTNNASHLQYNPSTDDDTAFVLQ